MTVLRIATPRGYVGVAADTPPTTDPDDGQAVPAGSTFFERDTGLQFIYDGSAWGQIIFPTTL